VTAARSEIKAALVADLLDNYPHLSVEAAHRGAAIAAPVAQDELGKAPHAPADWDAIDATRLAVALIVKADIG